MLSSRSPQEISAALRDPVDQAKLAVAIKDLLGLYWVPADSPEDRARQIALFVRDLAKFPDAVVAYAVHDWRTTQDRRPSIASLHQLCMCRQRALMERAAYLSPPDQAPDPTPSAEQIEQRRALIGQALAKNGFVKRETGWVSPGVVAEEKEQPRKPHWSETAAPDDPKWAALRRARAENPLMNQGGA